MTDGIQPLVASQIEPLVRGTANPSGAVPLVPQAVAPPPPQIVIPLSPEEQGEWERKLLAYVAVPFDANAVADPAAEIANVVALLRRLPNHEASFIAWFNLAMLHAKAGDMQRSAVGYDAVLEKKPDFMPAIINKSVVLEGLGRVDEAANLLKTGGQHPLEWQRTALNQRGRMLEIAGRLEEAENDLLRSLLLDPKQVDVIHHFAHLRAKQCRWPVLINLPGLPIDDQMHHMGTLSTISHFDDPGMHHNVTRDWVDRKYPPMPDARIFKSPRRASRDQSRRLRVGFMSSDLRMHVVSILAIEFFESLDRTRIETFAFDFSHDDGSPFRARVLKAFEHHVPIKEDGDEAAARKIADAEVDVLIDLNGMTSNARPGVLRRKPAPVIMSWLGSLTTTGLEEVDYFITDRFVFSPESEASFSEKPIFLETGMHLNANDRVIAPTPSRSDFGLPDDAFVFCAFNNNYKINPAMLADWAEIVRSVPGSILWLQADNIWSEQNLRREARALGLDDDRLAFANRVMPDQYLARFRLADLYLDTFPCNAGATAIDCLFTGLPILTVAGRSVPARTAAGILTHAGVPELIAPDRTTYRQWAIDWGCNPALLGEVRAKLAWETLRKTKLFDTAAKAREFEDMLTRVVEAMPVQPAPIQTGPTQPKRTGAPAKNKRQPGGKGR